MRGFPRAVAAAVGLVTVVALAVPGLPSAAAEPAGRSRASGGTPAESAAGLARAGFAAGASTAVLVGTDAVAESIAATALAGVLDAPILFADRDRLPAATVGALHELGVRRLVVAGGPAAVAPSVERAAERLAWVVRFGAEDAYATAAELGLAAARLAGGVGRMADRRVVLLASGRDLDGAVAAAATAAAGAHPLLLTEPDRLSPAAAAALVELAPDRVIVVGGRGAVSRRAARQVAAGGAEVVRIAGTGRAELAARLAELASRPGSGVDGPAVVVNGERASDVLAAAAYAAGRDAPVLLASGAATLGGWAAAWLSAHARAVRAVEGVGETTALADRVLADAARAAGAGSRTIPYTVRTRGAVAGDTDEFARQAAAALADPRGWSLGGAVRYERVDAGGAFTLWLAAPDTLPTFSAACSARWSCRAGADVVVNDARWREGAPRWPGALAEYRAYVVNHEVGHWLGLGHRSCGGAGRPAPVMMQQSKGVGRCEARVWPLPDELAAAARRLLDDPSR